MDEKARVVVDEIIEKIQRQLIGDKSISPADCVEGLDEIESECSEWSSTIRSEHGL